MRCAPASTAFSTSSLTTLAGRSTTSPAAIWLARSFGRRRTTDMAESIPAVVSDAKANAKARGDQRRRSGAARRRVGEGVPVVLPLARREAGEVLLDEDAE